MLDLVNCKVLSVVESDHIDAYLLSESSMFIWPHKLILKTCGTTTLLLGLRRMFQIAATEAGFPAQNLQSRDDTKAAATPYRIFYSRKNFLFPQKQQGPHKSWRDEVKYLDAMFSGGSAYLVGKMNGDHWYLYITEPDLTMITPAITPAATQTQFLEIPDTAQKHPTRTIEDETLEILMTDLGPENGKQFYLENALACAEQQFPRLAKIARKEVIDSLGDLTLDSMVDSLTSDGTVASNNSETVFSTASPAGTNTPAESVENYENITEGHALGSVVAQTCGLTDVYSTTRYPDAKIDAYLFNPCGFSANGVIPAQGQETCSPTHYFTVHVTPEPQCSYASFETNVPGCQTGRETIDVIKDVVNIFKPGRFSVTLFEAKSEGDDEVIKVDSPTDLMAGSGILRSAKMEKIPGYRRIDRIVHEFDGYDLVFRYYEREGWKGGTPRVGDIDL